MTNAYCVPAVNNAGTALSTQVEAASITQVRAMFDVHFFAVGSMCRAFLPMLRQTQGRIIQMSSMSGRVRKSHCLRFCFL